MSIHEKLLKIQINLKAPKSQYNSFGKYNYRTAEDIMEAVKPLTEEVNATLKLTDSIVSLDGRFYVESTAMLTDVETGEFVDSKGFAREEDTKKGMDASQITGAASSYARKYALNGLFCIDDTKDSDSTNMHGKDENKQQEKSPTSNTNIQETSYKCSLCGTEINKKVAEFSHSRYKKLLCMDCQKRQ